MNSRTLSPYGFTKPLLDSRLFLEVNVFCFLFSRSRCILLLDTSVSVGINALTYLGLVANVWDDSNSGDKKTLQVLRDVQLALINIFTRMPLLEHGNDRNNSRGEITHGQPIGKKISYRPYKRIASFNGYFYKEDFLDWLLDLEDLFDYENIWDERKVELALYKLREYTLRWWKRMQFDRVIWGN